MAGVGNYTKIASAIILTVQALGYIDESARLDDMITALAVALFLAGELWAQVGTWLRSDLHMGIKRTEPLE